MKPEASIEGKSGEGRFATTRWSVILSCAQAQSGDAKVQEALSLLCRTYWRPVFAFICRRGYQPNDAQDLTQDFFLMILQGNFLEMADPARGRFRSLLLASLRNFLSDAAVSRLAQKRGGQIQFVSWDDWMAEAPSRLSVAYEQFDHWSPERIYDVRWAATIVEHALGKLGEECEAKGRRRVFDVLNGTLASDRADVSYPVLSKTLGVPEASIKRLVHQLRRRYRELLRAEVAETVENPSDVDEELRYLCAALAAGQA